MPRKEFVAVLTCRREFSETGRWKELAEALLDSKPGAEHAHFVCETKPKAEGMKSDAYFFARNFSQLLDPLSAGVSPSAGTESSPHSLSESSLMDRVIAAFGA